MQSWSGAEKAAAMPLHPNKRWETLELVAAAAFNFMDKRFQSSRSCIIGERISKNIPEYRTSIV